MPTVEELNKKRQELAAKDKLLAQQIKKIEGIETAKERKLRAHKLARVGAFLVGDNYKMLYDLMGGKEKGKEPESMVRLKTKIQEFIDKLDKNTGVVLKEDTAIKKQFSWENK